MNDFEYHKTTLENLLQKIDFIYSGDVISSVEIKFNRDLKHKSFSASFVKEIIIDIYKKSFNRMIEKSEEIIVNKNSFHDIYDFMDGIPLIPKILFYSNNSNLNLNLGDDLIKEDDDKSYLPDYFIRRFQLMSHNKQVSAYYSPLIEDSEDDCHFYLIDRPIQSMVWSLQNMIYDIKFDEFENYHLIKLPIYECDFKAYRVRVVDAQKLRNDKINSILDDN
jgi:hypothetical protein